VFEDSSAACRQQSCEMSPSLSFSLGGMKLSRTYCGHMVRICLLVEAASWRPCRLNLLRSTHWASTLQEGAPGHLVGTIFTNPHTGCMLSNGHVWIIAVMKLDVSNMVDRRCYHAFGRMEFGVSYGSSQVQNPVLRLCSRPSCIGVPFHIPEARYQWVLQRMVVGSNACVSRQCGVVFRVRNGNEVYGV
jgi:hypothetical protein